MDVPESEQDIRIIEEELREAQREMGPSGGQAGEAQWVSLALRAIEQVKFLDTKVKNKV